MTSRSFIRSGEGAALVGALVLTDSLHYIFARWLTATFVPILSVALMMTIAAIEVGLFGLLSKNLRLRIGRRQIGILFVIACLIAFSSYASFLSVSYIDPGTAALLGKSGIVFSLGLSLLWLKERLGRGQVLGALLAIAGTFTIVAHPAEFVRLGSILVLLTALSYSFHAAITKRYLGDLNFLDFFFYRLLFTSTILLSFTFVSGAFRWPTAIEWLMLLLVATLNVSLGRGVYYLTLRRINMSIHATLLTLSPVVTIGWALLMFDVLPGWREILGGAAILGGVVLVVWGRAAEAHSDG